MFPSFLGSLNLPKMQETNPQDRDLEFNNLPNQLTLMRIIAVPLVIFFLYLREPLYDYIATALFSLASITDYFDGYFARKLKIETIYGKLMDPLADKFLVIGSLIMLQDLGRIHAIVVMLLVYRELTITGLRALASAEGLVMGASGGGKWKTATQMVAIPMLMARDFWGIPFVIIGNVLLYMSLALSLWSAKDYLFDFFRTLKRTRAARRSLKKQLKAERKAARKAAKKAKN